MLGFFYYLVAARKLVKKNNNSKTHIFLQLFVIYICNGGEQVVGGTTQLALT